MPAPEDKTIGSRARGIFYVVATPIGNLSDISARALETLRNVDTILAEDTRHSRPLLNHYGISTPLRACHEHNEAGLVHWVSDALLNGENLALISDAGTPLISDPGFVLVRALRAADFQVSIIPGPSSIIAALAISGLATDAFLYAGFLPAKSSARRTALAEFENEVRTVVLLESSHRIVACLQDVVSVLGADRRVVLARELTKRYETVLDGTAAEVLQILLTDSNQTRGEFVLMLGGADKVSAEAEHAPQLKATLRVLLSELPVKQAAALAAKLCACGKNDAYKLALELRQERDAGGS